MQSFLALLALYLSTACSKTSNNAFSDYSLMITQKVASEAVTNLTESGHTPHLVKDTIDVFVQTAPSIIEEELGAIKSELENEHQKSLSKRSQGSKQGAFRKGASHAKFATNKIRQKMENSLLNKQNGLSKRYFASMTEVTLGTVLKGTVFGSIIILVGILLLNLIFFFSDLCFRFWRFGLGGPMYGYGGYAGGPYAPGGYY